MKERSRNYLWVGVKQKAEYLKAERDAKYAHLKNYPKERMSPTDKTIDSKVLRQAF